MICFRHVANSIPRRSLCISPGSLAPHQQPCCGARACWSDVGKKQWGESRDKNDADAVSQLTFHIPRRTVPRLSLLQGFEEPDLTGFDSDSDSDDEQKGPKDAGTGLGREVKPEPPEDSELTPPEPAPRLLSSSGSKSFVIHDRRQSHSKLPPPNAHLVVSHGEDSSSSNSSHNETLPGLPTVGSDNGSGSLRGEVDVSSPPATEVATAAAVSPGNGKFVAAGESGAVLAKEGVGDGVNLVGQKEELLLLQEDHAQRSDIERSSRVSSSVSMHARDSSEDSGFGTSSLAAVGLEGVSPGATVDAGAATAAPAAVSAGRQHKNGIVGTIARSFAAFSPTKTAAAALAVEDTRGADLEEVAPGDGGSGQAVAVVAGVDHEVEWDVGAQGTAVGKETVEEMAVKEPGSVAQPVCIQGERMTQEYLPPPRELLRSGGVGVQSGVGGTAAAGSSGVEEDKSRNLTLPQPHVQRGGSFDTTASEVSSRMLWLVLLLQRVDVY